MADQVFMYATTAGVMIGLAVLLFVVRGRRSIGVKATISGLRVTKDESLRDMIRMANPFMNNIYKC